VTSKYSIQAVFQAVDKLTAPVSAMQRRVEGMTRAVNRNIEGLRKVTGGLKDGIEAIGARAAAVGAVAGLVGRDVVQVGVDFDRTIVAAAAKFDPALKRGTAGFNELREAAKKTGASTEFSASQAAKALESFASAGMNKAQAIAALPRAVDFATAAGFTDLGDAATVVSKSLGAFDMMSEDAAKLERNIGRLTDGMAKTANATGADMKEMYDTIRRSGSISVAAGQQLESYLAMLGTLANSTIEGGDAGTVLKNVFKRLAAPPKMAKDALSSLKVTTTDKKGDLLPVLDILDQIDKKTAGMGSAKRLGLLSAIFGEEASSGAVALLNTGADKLRALTEQIEGATGSTKQLADTMRDTVGGDIDNFTSALEGVKIELFDTNQGPLRDVLKGMTEWVDENKGLIVQRVQDTIGWIADHMEDIVKWGERIGGVVAAVYAIDGAAKVAEVATKGVELAVKGVQGAFTVLRGMFAASAWLAANPIVLIVAAAIAAAAAIYIYREEIGAYLGELWDGLKEIGAFLGDTFVEAWTAASAAVSAAWASTVAFFGELWDGVSEKVTSVVDTFRSAWASVFDWFSGAWSTISDGVTSALDSISAKLASVAGFFGGDSAGGPMPAMAGGYAMPDVRSTTNVSHQRTTETYLRESREKVEVVVSAAKGATAEVTKNTRRGSPVAVTPSGAL
jgi:TP901 family phage tail tape measure protein